MKKSKIIAPALGVLILSTAAAVTGTVAWFTATRIRTVGMAGISAVNPEQGLLLTYAKPTNSSPITIEDESTEGTHYNSTSGVVEEGASLKVTHVQLRDASVNMSASDPTVFGSTLDEDGSLSGVVAKDFSTPDTKKYNNQNVYFATSFELKFKVSRAETGYKQHLLLDQGKSSVTAPAATDETKSIKRALRIGFKASSDWFVWAPFTTDAVGNSGEALRYVTAAGDNEGTVAYYSASQVILNNASAGASSYAEDVAVDNLPTLGTVTAYAGYLAELSETETSVKIYTWFEGTDTGCNNDAQALAAEFTSSLVFAMRKSKNS